MVRKKLRTIFLFFQLQVNVSLFLFFKEYQPPIHGYVYVKKSVLESSRRRSRLRLRKGSSRKYFKYLNTWSRIWSNWKREEWSLDKKSTFTWDPKWTQTGLKSQTALKSRSVYMAISPQLTLKSQTHFENCSVYIAISLLQLSN